MMNLLLILFCLNSKWKIGNQIKGEMLVTLRYDPQYGRMIIGLIELRSLPSSQDNKEKSKKKIVLTIFFKCWVLTNKN